MTVAERETIEQRFRGFHQQNPRVYDALRKLAVDLVQMGHERVGMKMLFEVVRWQHAMRTTKDGGFKLNNDFTALYARLLMDREPALAGRFETREMRGARLPDEPVFQTDGQGSLL